MTQSKKNFWGIGVVVGIILIISPQVAYMISHPFQNGIRSALTIFGALVTFVSLVRMK